MKFAVRYWSSLRPDYRKPGGEPRWTDFSLHPATKLGLHNALLTLQDRLQILEQHGGLYACAVFVLEFGKKEEKLTQEAAEYLFASLPHGEVKWLDIRDFLLLPSADERDSGSSVHEGAQAQQLHLFEQHHTPYDDVEMEYHDFDADA
jgi:hypothetical protein